MSTIWVRHACSDLKYLLPARVIKNIGSGTEGSVILQRKSDGPGYYVVVKKKNILKGLAFVIDAKFLSFTKMIVKKSVIELGICRRSSEIGSKRRKAS